MKAAVQQKLRQSAHAYSADPYKIYILWPVNIEIIHKSVLTAKSGFAVVFSLTSTLPQTAAKAHLIN
jgi:hypothetical protein